MGICFTTLLINKSLLRFRNKQQTAAFLMKCGRCYYLAQGVDIPLICLLIGECIGPSWNTDLCLICFFYDTLLISDTPISIDATSLCWVMSCATMGTLSIVHIIHCITINILHRDPSHNIPESNYVIVKVIYLADTIIQLST